MTSDRRQRAKRRRNAKKDGNPRPQAADPGEDAVEDRATHDGERAHAHEEGRPAAAPLRDGGRDRLEAEQDAQDGEASPQASESAANGGEPLEAHSRPPGGDRDHEGGDHVSYAHDGDKDDGEDRVQSGQEDDYEDDDDWDDDEDGLDGEEGPAQEDRSRSLRRRDREGARGSGSVALAPGRPERRAEVGARRSDSQSLSAKSVAFLKASWAELQRVQWPNRREVSQATAVVLGFVAVAGIYLGVADWVAQKIINFIL